MAGDDGGGPVDPRSPDAPAATEPGSPDAEVNGSSQDPEGAGRILAGVEEAFGNLGRPVPPSSDEPAMDELAIDAPVGDEPVTDEPLEEPGAHLPPDTTPPQRSAPVGTDLFDVDPDIRLAALARMDEAAPPLPLATLDRLMRDPDARIRAWAALALGRCEEHVPDALIERGLRDPDDRVRAAMVDVGATRPSLVSLIVALATDRGWPDAQRAALDMLPGLLSEIPAGAGDALDQLLQGVGALDPPPFDAEVPALAATARAMGPDVLAERTGGTGLRRLGAIRLLVAEGSRRSLTLVSGLHEDQNDEVRRAAQRAADLTGGRPMSEQRTRPPAGSGAKHDGAGADGTDLDDELIVGLARALADPDEGVRARARSSLAGVNRPPVEAWTKRALSAGNVELAALAAAVAEALDLRDVAALVLERACDAPAHLRGPFLRAMAGLRLAPDDLAAALAAVDTGHRPEAVRLAWQVGGVAVLPTLRSMIEDSSGPVRVAVLEAFAGSSDPEAAELARRVLADDASAMVRATAVHTLARSTVDDRAAGLEQALTDPDPDVRATAVETLPQGVQERMGDLLLRALEDPEERVWYASIRHLIALRGRHLGSLWRAIRGTSPVKREEIVRAIESTDPDLLSELAMAYADQDDRSARALAVEIAARAGTPECRARVIAALEDPDPLVRRAAAVSMSTVRTPAAVSALARSLSDPQVEVRVEVVRALSLIDDNEVLPVLISALKDPEVRVRDMAAEALARWRSPGVSRRLAAALSEPDLRRAARDLLERMGEAAVDALVGIVLGDDREAARLAGELLERVAGPHPFVAALSSVDPGQRLRSVEVLGAMGDPTASEALLTTLSDPDERVRVRAIELLGELGDPRAIDPLRRAFLSDPVVRVAVAAEEALRRLGSPPTLPQETVAHGFSGFGDDEPSSGSEGRPENEHQNEA